MTQTTPNLILGSKSPRRQDIMQQAGYVFELREQDTDESFPESLPLANVAEYVAGVKARAFADQLSPADVLITADTVVILQNDILGKPKGRAEAAQMLSRLSDKTHTVITGVCISTLQRQKVFSSKTKVTFNNLRKADIDFYLDHYQPFDKAGAYGVQEWIGMIGIRRIEGSYYNVMGLPIDLLYHELPAFGIFTSKPSQPHLVSSD